MKFECRLRRPFDVSRFAVGVARIVGGVRDR